MRSAHRAEQNNVQSVRDFSPPPAPPPNPLIASLRASPGTGTHRIIADRLCGLTGTLANKSLLQARSAGGPLHFATQSYLRLRAKNCN
jgi:hypothetical protein